MKIIDFQKTIKIFSIYLPSPGTVKIPTILKNNVTPMVSFTVLFLVCLNPFDVS